MTTAFSLNPLLRQSIGFDRFNDLFETALAGEEKGNGYPPYNIERHGENDYFIVMALAGFRQQDVQITVEKNTLVVSGKMADKTENDVAFIHRGIANRAFERKFSLADTIEVKAAELKDGLLNIKLERIIPEEAKPKTIPIN